MFSQVVCILYGRTQQTLEHTGIGAILDKSLRLRASIAVEEVNERVLGTRNIRKMCVGIGTPQVVHQEDEVELLLLETFQCVDVPLTIVSHGFESGITLQHVPCGT